MTRAAAAALEFDKVVQLVATQARTELGRALITASLELPSRAEAAAATRLTEAVERLLQDGDALTLAGLDEAWQWLSPGAPAATDPRDLLALLTLARRIAAVRRRLLAGPAELGELLGSLPDTTELIQQVAPRLARDGTIPDQASPELARLRRLATRLRQEVLVELEAIRRGHADVVTDAPPTVRRDRYCLPVRAAARAQLPGLVLDTSGTGATAFVEPFAAVELNNQLAEAIAGERDEVRRIVAEIATLFERRRAELVEATRILAQLDAVQARVRFGQRCGGRIVGLGGAPELILRHARHPLLDERLRSLRVEVFGEVERRDPTRPVVPLDFELPLGARVLVVSGPNAGGKTVVLKTLGLMVLMAGHGIPLPVDEGTAIPDIDHLWCHIGDEQDVAADLSSFSGAMAATVDLLGQAGQHSLVLYDELGAGTDPLEGAALGCALLEELAARRCLTVASTHLAAIAMAAADAAHMDNAAMGYDEDVERPTYRLTTGRPGRSRAFEIAARTGISSSIVARARELVGGQHLELHRWLERLERLEGELEEQRLDLGRRRCELELLEQQTAEARARLEDERRELPAQLAEERDRLRRRAQRRLDEALERLDRAVAEHEALGRRQRQRLREQALADTEPAPAAGPAAAAELAPDTPVRVTSLGRSGVLEEVRGRSARVSVDGKRLWVQLAELTPDTSSPDRRTPATVEVHGAEVSTGDLVLLGMDSERAREALEQCLDQALAAGRPRVRVVHGHGAGVLRRTVAEVCRDHPAVRSFRHPPQHLGGTGVTEVELHEGS